MTVIKSGQRLTAALLNEIYVATEPWIDWVPTLTNLTQGDGSITARYLLVGKTLDYRFKFVLGSTSAVGTSPKFTLPFTPHDSYEDDFETVIGRGVLFDSGVANRDAVARIAQGTTATAEVLNSSAGAHADITATAPWTWAAADAIFIAGRIEIE